MHLSLVPKNRRLAAQEVIRFAFERSLKACDPNYRRHHLSAWTTPRSLFECALAGQLHALANYADAYQAQWPGYRLAQDGVLGDAWKRSLQSFRDLLNGESGRFDCGALDAAACDLFTWAGFNEDEL